MVESLVYTSEEARTVCKLSRDLFWRLVHTGMIPALKVSDRKYIFSKLQIEKFINGESPKAG
jgi:hypothetical protein